MIRWRERRNGKKGQKGQSLVEVALITPVLFLLLGISADVSRMFLVLNTITNAGREGALYASHHATNPNLDADTKAVIRQEERGAFAAIQCPVPLQITITRTDSSGVNVTGSPIPKGPPGLQETVVVSCDVPISLTFLPLPPTFHLSGRSESFVVNYDG